MTGHNLMVLFAVLTLMAAGGANLATAKLLGPTHHERMSAAWPWRLFFLFAAFVLIGSGAALAFPGPKLAVGQMSAWVPLRAIVMLGLSVIVLDHVVKKRAPPPLIERAIRLALRRGVKDEAAVELAMALPAASYRPSASPPRSSRLAMLSLGILAIVVVAAAIGSAVIAGPA